MPFSARLIIYLMVTCNDIGHLTLYRGRGTQEKCLILKVSHGGGSMPCRWGLVAYRGGAGGRGVYTTSLQAGGRDGEL